jgi:hypothetical protein
VSSNPFKEIFGKQFFEFEYDQVAEILESINKSGVDSKQAIQYMKHYPLSVNEWKYLLENLSLEELQWMVRLGVEPHSNILGQYRKFLKEIEAEPDTINVLTHAQRRQHFFSLLNQVEKRGEITTDNYALRSKILNNVLGVNVEAYSPNGASTFGKHGLNTVSTELNHIQNGYGTYIWVMDAAEVLNKDAAVFTYMGNVDSLQGNSGEIGILSEADQVYEEALEGKLEGDIAQDLVREKLTRQSLRTGIDLHRATTLCLVPEEEFSEVIATIDHLNIPEDDKHFIRNQIVPYDQESDPLGNATLTDLRVNPQKYADRVRKNDPDFQLKKLRMTDTLLGATNIQKRPNGVGYKIREVPVIGRYDPRTYYDELLMVLARATEWNIEEYLQRFHKETLYPIVGLFRSVIAEGNEKKETEQEIISRVQSLATLLQKEINEVTAGEIQFLSSLGISLDGLQTTSKVEDALFKKFFPLASIGDILREQN